MPSRKRVDPETGNVILEEVQKSEILGDPNPPARRVMSTAELNWARKNFVDKWTTAPWKIPEPVWRKRGRLTHDVTVAEAASIVGCTQKQYLKYEAEENVHSLPEDLRKFFASMAESPSVMGLQ